MEACPTGGALLGSPAVNLIIEPDGTVFLSSTHQTFYAPTPYSAVGTQFPQTCVPHKTLSEAAMAIGKACFDRDLIGFLTVSFVTFEDDFRTQVSTVVFLQLLVVHVLTGSRLHLFSPFLLL